MSKKQEPIDVSEWDIVHLNASPDYIGEADFLSLNGGYREREFTIKSMTREPPPNPKTKQKLVDIIAFEDHEKRFIVNQTNKNRISNQYGRKAKDWFGKKITIFFDTSEKYRNPQTGEMGRGSVRVKPQ